MTVLLKANTVDDIPIIGGMVQDGLFPKKDCLYAGDTGIFAIVLSRFCWENNIHTHPPYERTHSILHFSNVVSVKFKDIHQSESTILTILSLIPVANSDGSYYVYISLSGGGIIRVHIDVVNITIKDVGDIWQTNNMPCHDMELS